MKKASIWKVFMCGQSLSLQSRVWFRLTCATAISLFVLEALQAQAVSGDKLAVAIVNDSPITREDLARAVGDRLLKIRTDEYNIQMGALEAEIEEALLKQEASRRNMTLTEFVGVEIKEKARPVEPVELSAIYESNRNKYGEMREAVALKVIKMDLETQRILSRRKAVVAELRAKGKVETYLAAPRAISKVDRGYEVGPSDAPITIVEFSDFQCPFCSKVQSTLDQLKRENPDRIRLVFRHFPLPIHKDAEKASEASLCAGEQGKFWQMHDRLFTNQTNLEQDALLRFSVEVGVEADRFRQCLESGKFRTQIVSDRVEGSKIGISGTPTFLINGRLLVGAASYADFSRVINEELGTLKASKETKK